MKTNYTCPICGKAIFVRPYRFKRTKVVTCGRACRLIALGQGHEKLTCLYCGKQFKRARSHVKTMNFCSRQCMGNWQSENMRGESSPTWRGERVVKPCANCGKDVIRPKWWISKNNSNFFCDRACFSAWKAKNWTGESNPAWLGGHDQYYGKTWKRQRNLARKRDKYTCRICGIPEKAIDRELDVHHIKPFRLFDDYREANRLKNLITVCHPCHMDLEHGRVRL